MVSFTITRPGETMFGCSVFSVSIHFQRTDGKPHKKLGILGGTFEDGSFSVFVIPDPADMAPDSSQPIYGSLM